MKCKTCKINLEPPYYISCEVCDARSCMAHGVEIHEGFACSETCAEFIKKVVNE